MRICKDSLARIWKLDARAKKKKKKKKKKKEWVAISHPFFLLSCYDFAHVAFAKLILFYCHQPN